MALGAGRCNVVMMVMRRGMALALIGIGLGLAGALSLTRVIGGMVYGVPTTDPLTLATVSVVLIIVALVACVVPARRAATVDPLAALRYE